MNIKLSMLCCFLIPPILIASCAGTHKIKPRKYECSSKVAEAGKKIANGKYGAARIILDDVKLQCAGHEVMDTVSYYLGTTLMHLKFYTEAKSEYTRLTQDFPTSPFFEEAEFMIALSVYKTSRPVDRDQAETKEAITLFRDFIETHPSGVFADSARKYLGRAVEKLAEKEYNSARFYQKTGEKEAAVICYKSFVNEYAGSGLAPQAQLNMGQLLIELGRKAEAREVLDGLVAKENNGDYARKARELLGRLKDGN